MINEQFGLGLLAEALRAILRQFEILDQFEIVVGDKWDIADNRRQTFDIAIYRQDEAYAIVEIVRDLETKSAIKSKVAKVIPLLQTINAQFLILTNNQVYQLYDAKGKLLANTSKLEEVVGFFRELDNLDVQREKKIKVAHAIISAAEKKFSINKSKNRTQKKEFLSWLQGLRQTLQEKIQYTGGFYYFDGFRNSDEQSFEFDFFRYLLSDGEPITEIYRYTSFDSLYHTLEGQSLRISGIAGMNDKTEAFYFDKYLDGTKKAFWESGVSPNTIAAVNRRFILSSSLLEDDLTQWRLYGDDSKGVCLVFTPKTSSKHSLVLAKISYAKKDKSHPELDFIILFTRALKKVGITFKLRYSYIWKHFFKPNDYEIEKEVRLLVIMAKSGSKLQKGWIPTTSHKLLNPYVVYDINSAKLPLKLKKIVLGSKCPEKEVNRVQIKQMLSERPKFSALKVDVTLSLIDNYR